MTPINRPVTIPDRLGFYLAASAELTFSTFGLAALCLTSLSLPYCGTYCAIFMWCGYRPQHGLTGSKPRHTGRHNNGSSALPFSIFVFFFFLLSPCNVCGVRYRCTGSVCVGQVRPRNEAQVDQAQDSTGCCLPEIGIADDHPCRTTVCIDSVHIRGSTPSSAVSCCATHTVPMPRLGLGSTMCCIYSYWSTVATRRLDDSTAATPPLLPPAWQGCPWMSSVFIAFTYEVGELVSQA